MKLSVVMPQLGLTMTEGIISEWLKKPGEMVKKGEFLFTVSTDKADMEVESMAEGTLSEVVVDVGKTVPVGTVIAYLEKPGEEMSLSDPAKAGTAERASMPARPEPVPSSLQEEVPRREPVKKERPTVSPRARRVAKDLGVDLENVQGTGTAGRVVEKDVRRAAQETLAQGAEESSRRRRIIAGKMVESAQTIPYFTVSVEANAEALLSLLGSLKETVEEPTGVKFTITDVLLRSMAIALAKTPRMRAVWEGEEVRTRDSVDLGVAIATGEGVVSPVIHGIENLDVGAIAQRLSELVDKTRRRRLSLRDFEGGIGTLSNLGMYRIDQFQAMITPGQSFVLATGQIRRRPWVEEPGLAVRSTIILNLSVDHRAVDGAVASEFIRKIADIIENPYRILWDPPLVNGKGEIR